MARVLLTGGNGFVASHILELLLQQGYSVVTTVRTRAKADRIKSRYPHLSKSQLDFAIVPDIASSGSFDEAVKSDPPFEAVIHTASPLLLNSTDTKKDLLDPAINGTIGLLKSIQAYAPSIKRVIYTSSFAAVVDPTKLFSSPDYCYTAEDWCSVTESQANTHPFMGYLASKTFAEKAAWEFVKEETTTFTLTVINPPLILGPVIHGITSPDMINNSNQRIFAIMKGDWKAGAAENDGPCFVDVRDVAMAHIRAIEHPESSNHRLLFIASHFSNKEIVDIIRKNFPEYRENLPAKDNMAGDYPDGGFTQFDNGPTAQLLGGIKFRSLESSVVDTVLSLKHLL